MSDCKSVKFFLLFPDFLQAFMINPNQTFVIIRLTGGLLDGSIVGKYEEIGFRKGDVARLGQAELWYQCDE